MLLAGWCLAASILSAGTVAGCRPPAVASSGLAGAAGAGKAPCDRPAREECAVIDVVIWSDIV